MRKQTSVYGTTVETSYTSTVDGYPPIQIKLARDADQPGTVLVTVKLFNSTDTGYRWTEVDGWHANEGEIGSDEIHALATARRYRELPDHADACRP